MKRANGVALPRVGDPNAPRARPARWRLIVATSLVMLALVFGFASFAVWRNLTYGTPEQFWGTVVGLSISVVVCIVGGFIWRRHWTDLRRAVARTQAARAGNLVIGGRLPAMASTDAREIWPGLAVPTVPARYVVLSVDRQTLTLLSPGEAPTPLLQVPLRDLVSVTPVEFVEGGNAYDGLAIVGPTEASSVVLQPIRIRRIGVRFPRGQELATLARQIDELRSGSDE